MTIGEEPVDSVKLFIDWKAMFLPVNICKSYPITDWCRIISTPSTLIMEAGIMATLKK